MTRWCLAALLLASALGEPGERGERARPGLGLEDSLHPGAYLPLPALARLNNGGAYEVGIARSRRMHGTDRVAPSGGGIGASSRQWVASAYCACPEICCPPPRGGSGLTASGAPPRQGWTLACPPEIPLGTLVRVTVAGLGSRLFACQDRGAAITGRRVDVYHDSHDAAIAFGLRPARVEVVR